ncbi:hypothetical protein [Rhizohabitans arisaemae]|uniref:hypothetical protein n=1 Tax=Rhizohabitans arisaemae TaxID=2720610 RepID=UPI0024B1DE5F|nr:hypothetical protein [Rhizohabitans arisaemae]
MELLRGLRRRLDLADVFVTHDPGVVRQIAERAAVMCLGRIVKIGMVGEVLSRPAHPYA